jgi:hypothetical protein
MNFRFLTHLARALALVLLIGTIAVLSLGNAVWASRSENAKIPPRSTVPKKEADLSIVKKVRAASSYEYIFTITVKNNSSIAAEEVVVTDQLSKRLELEYARGITPGVNVKCSGDRIIKCRLGTLGAGKSVKIEIRVDVWPSNYRGSITNTALVSSKTKDPNSKNNKSSVTFKTRGRR